MVVVVIYVEHSPLATEANLFNHHDEGAILSRRLKHLNNGAVVIQLLRRSILFRLLNLMVLRADDSLDHFGFMLVWEERAWINDGIDYGKADLLGIAFDLLKQVSKGFVFIFERARESLPLNRLVWHYHYRLVSCRGCFGGLKK